MLEKQMSDLKAQIVGFSYHVENMIDSSIVALRNGDKDLFVKIIEEIEPKANKMELEIDKNCISLIAQYGPKAGNLRTIVMILKINNDLERMADNCVSICHEGNQLINSPVLKSNIEEISEIAEMVCTMLKNGILSFVNSDPGLAKKVCKKDKVINKFRDNKILEFIEEMKKTPELIESYLSLIKICNRLERIADLSTNNAENAFFATKGKVLKHKKKKKSESKK